MSFESEPTGYEKTAVSVLQGSWGNLRDSVVNNFGFSGSERLLLHIDEAMSWESVRNLERMNSTLILIQNIVVQSNVPEEIVDSVSEVRLSYEATIEAISQGEAF